MIKDRQAAISAGDIHYVGKPCSVCGSKIRYTISANCVACVKRVSTESRNRIRAIKQQSAAA